jgi:hypothetical protein
MWGCGGSWFSFRFTRPARLPRDVPEKSEGFPCGTPPDHHELRPFVALHHGFSRSMRKAIVFFRPITRRIEMVGSRPVTINSVALCTNFMPARELKCIKNTRNCCISDTPQLREAKTCFHRNQAQFAETSLLANLIPRAQWSGKRTAEFRGFIAPAFLYSFIKIPHCIQWFMIAKMRHVNRNAQNIPQVLRGTLLQGLPHVCQ